MQINLSKVAECSEVALFEKTFVIFTIKSMMNYRGFGYRYRRQKHILIVLIAPVGIKCHMS